MNSFLLYDNLSKSNPKKDITPAKKQELIENISKIDKAGHRLIYALIHAHEITSGDHTDTPSHQLPYGGEFVKRDMQYDLGSLPIPLRHILYKFTCLHIKSMEVDKLMEEQRPITTDVSHLCDR